VDILMAQSAQLKRLEARLLAIPKAVKEAVQPSLLKSGNELADLMKSLVAVDTGDTRDSIAVTPAGQSTPPYSQPGGSMVVPENAVAITAGNEKVRTAHLLEYGTTKAPAQPFFWVSYRLLKPRIRRRTLRDLGKVVREWWRK
jgi:HK97 gp10 family phage protein